MVQSISLIRPPDQSFVEARRLSPPDLALPQNVLRLEVCSDALAIWLPASTWPALHYGCWGRLLASAELTCVSANA